MPKDYSFGVIPFYRDGGNIKYLAIKHRAGHWGLPKGHKERNETDIETAKREFVEETGIKDYKIFEDRKCITESYVAFHKELGEVEKTVCYFIAEVFDMNAKIDGKEIVDFVWGDFETINSLLSHKEIRDVLSTVNSEINR